MIDLDQLEQRVLVLERRVGSPGDSGLEKSQSDLSGKIGTVSRDMQAAKQSLIGIYDWAQGKAVPALKNHRVHLRLLWAFCALEALGMLLMWVTR